jgi:tungstate transport system substrate-binding protein
MNIRVAALALVAVLFAGSGCEQQQRNLVLATTTSMQDSGLLDLLIPRFEAQSGFRVKTIAVGSGQALKLAERGEADVLLAHAPEAERQVLAAGVVVERHLVMYNDFVVVGPPADPAKIAGEQDAAAALARIAGQGATFISRGDNSGTHQREQALWRKAGITPAGAWYQEASLGMGQTLTVASEKTAYTLTDRGTFLAMADKIDLRVLVEGDPALLNLYHVMQVNPDRYAKVNQAGARAWVEFLLSPPVQEEIGRFGLERFGRPLFTPAGGRTEAEMSGTASR